MSGWLCGCTANPHPLYACPGVPKAEAKPSTSDPRLEAALAALRAAPTAEGVDSAFMIGLWAGRAQAAADIREQTMEFCMDGLGRHLVAECARIAEGSDGTGTDRDEATLPASRGAPVPRLDTDGGSR